MGEVGGTLMSETLDDKFFDFAFRVLNYAIEFVNSPGYASLRMTDVLEKIVELSSQIDGVNRENFYVRLKERFRDRSVMADQKDREAFLDELSTVFIEEWRKERR